MSAAVTEVIYGQHAVEEALRAGRRTVYQLLIDGSRSFPFAEGTGVPVKRVERSALDAVGDHHQGIGAVVAPYPYSDLQTILREVRAAGREAVVLILDLLQDPQNLGALIRTAEAVGVQGILLPKRGTVRVTPAVVSASAGACEHLNIARVNLARAMEELKEAGLWIAGLENSEEAEEIYRANFKAPLAVVVGSEGKGLRRLVRETCDYLVRLPMQGSLASLNAAVAGSIALYEARRRGRGV